ncbi:hypothetical protein DY000_02056279 [Brassica cretica]|uniref:Uncharacterized protein n=1 Tax=Brassica cretica TaxID=69181 RepID=A0ABQ7AAZ0_BRACR|nr:hypothetical protein DY000_02056279 [Brassica cretica]
MGGKAAPEEYELQLHVLHINSKRSSMYVQVPSPDSRSSSVEVIRREFKGEGLGAKCCQRFICIWIFGGVCN